MPAPPDYDIGVIHGRFQILHNDHLKYLMAGQALCRHLVVGITNPDPMLTKTEAADPTRSDPMENPLTYFERYLMVKSVLIHAGVAPETFSIVPLPINLPERYQYYVPLDAVFFLTIYDQWGQQKKEYFESLGLTTHLLWRVPPEQKGISAGDIRQRIRTGRSWEHLVPGSVPPLIEQWGIAERLRQLESNR